MTVFHNEPSHHSSWGSSLLWWIDSVGGYLVLLKPRVRIGQAGVAENDVQIMADISAQHAEIHRSSSGVHLTAHAETRVNGESGSDFLLRHGDRIQMRSVEMRFHQPVPWCSTARLEITSPHRYPLALDGIILMGEACVVGCSSEAHLPTDWEPPLYINWHRDAYWIKSSGLLRIDGESVDESGPLTPNSEVEGTWGSFRWEPVQANY